MLQEVTFSRVKAPESLEERRSDVEEPRKISGQRRGHAEVIPWPNSVIK